MHSLLKRAAKKIKKPEMISTREWLEEYFRLPAEGADLPGPYNADYVPYLWGIFAALDNPLDRIVVMQKAAQIGWTYGLVGFIGKKIHTDPGAMMVLFPKEGTAREFSDEKLRPSVLSTPVLAERLDVTSARKAGQRTTFKRFSGGFLKMVGSNSISNVKSTPAPLVIVEEPDDTNDSVKEQGDAIRLSRERLKRFRNGKLVLGGTPSVKGLSRVEEFIELSDQRVLPIECHDCGESHTLDWDNVTWDTADAGREHPVYGRAKPDSAVYACPHCGSVWDDWQRQENIKDTVRKATDSGDPYCGWTPTVKTIGGVAGFKELNELYVCLPGTSLSDVVRDYLEAERDAELGDESGRIVFVNSKLGRPYEYKHEGATEDKLREAAKDYKELIVPREASVLTIGIDVQHNRLAVIVRAWGRSEESWLVYWGEIHAENTCVDNTDGAWAALDKLVFGGFAHECGATIKASAISIDTSDGGTSDASYHWVRTRGKKHKGVQVMAVKGSSLQRDPEIFTTPSSKSVDHHRSDRQTKADRHGVKVYRVGTNRAKDWLSGQMMLESQGLGRWHFYRDVRADYFDQLTSEVKAPHKSIRYRRVWQLRAGRRNEALDCEVYALHAARAARVHLMTPAQWGRLEKLVAKSAKVADNDAQGGKNCAALADLARRMNG